MSLNVSLTEKQKCPHCDGVLNEEEVYNANITHNLGKMASVAGIYEIMWEPEENTTAMQLVIPLQIGLDKLKADPEKHEKFNAANGWGTYENFVKFVQNYLDACTNNPTALVSASR